MTNKLPTERKPVTFRIRENYYKTFKMACKISGTPSNAVIESLMFKYIREFSEVLKEKKEDQQIFDMIAEVYGDGGWSKLTDKERNKFLKKFEGQVLEDIDGEIYKEKGGAMMVLDDQSKPITEEDFG